MSPCCAMSGSDAIYDQDGIRVLQGDALAALPALDAASIDAVVTDPPYGLGFMGANWDHGVPGVPFWAAVRRVLKPGAHVLAFGGTRTFHRLAVALEDAGFDLRDTIGWIYGNGFPKSLDVSKAIDKAAGVERPVVGEIRKSVEGMQPGLGGAFSDDGFAWKPTIPVTRPATDAATAWAGWGTGLKPAWEPILVARNPLDGSVVQNVLTHGTGALNLDAARIPADDGYQDNAVTQGLSTARTSYDPRDEPSVFCPSGLGRWPANVIHDGSADALALFPDVGPGGYPKHGGTGGIGTSGHVGYEQERRINTSPGNAARFFYCAKAGPSERWFYCRTCGEAFERDVRTHHRHGRPDWGHLISHPTQKPLALMKHLVGLITPPGGIVLDPFVGSGTTLIAAGAANFRAIGIDQDPDHCQIAAGRLRLRLGF